MRKYMIKRILMVVVGICLMGFSVSLFTKSVFGNDPYTTMNMGIAGAVGMTFGTLQVLVNAVLLILVILFAKHLIGFGTVFNMIGVGFIADFFTGLFQFDISDNLLARVVLLLVGTVLLCFACALYISANMGMSPYDAIGYIVTDKTKIHFRWCRIVLDVICTTIGFLCGAVLGVGTIITAFFTGPLVSFFREKVTDPMLEPPTER